MNQAIEQNAFNDLIGQFIKTTPKFRGKSRLIRYWMNHREKNSQRIRVLPGGAKVLCDLSVNYESMVWLEREEQKDLELVRNLLQPGQVFVDCGANIGIWTLVAASALGEAGKVYTFEPNPKTFEKLEKNISLAKLEGNVDLFSSAVGSENNYLPFECYDSHNVSQITATPDQNSILVKVITLDSTLGETKVDGIKIDVEGFELEVIKGAERILKNSCPWLCVEFNTLLTKVNRLGNWSVHQYLSELGYVCRQFQDALDFETNSILSDNWQTSGYCNLYYSMK